MIQVDLITGFLGSGKTTFLKEYVSYLTGEGEKVGIIENDFGAINIDMLILQDIVNDQCEIEQIVGGSVVSDWKRRFKAKMISMAMCGYTRILVEPSGIFDVDAFFDMLYDEPLDQWYQIGNLFAVVDADLEKNLSKQARYLLASQVAKAGIIVMSKVQSADKKAVSDTKKRILEILGEFQCNRILQDVFLEKPWEELTESDWEKLSHCGWKQADHQKLWFDQKDVFSSVFLMGKQMSEEALSNGVQAVFADPNCGQVFRIKGFCNVGTREVPAWLECNATKETFSVGKRNKGQDVLIFIGENLNEDVIHSKFDYRK